MGRESFDFVCSIGAACLCAQALREAGLRLSSGPFDWVSGGTLQERIGLVVRDFDGWMDAEDLEHIGNPNHFDHDTYRNRKTGLTYPHDFRLGVPFQDDYLSVRAKYDRRIARFLKCVRSSRHVLFVWIADALLDNSPTDDEVRASLDMMRRHFPGVDIEMLVIDRAEDDAGTGPMVRCDGYRRVACGYRKKSSGGRPWDIEMKPILRVLSRFQTVDHRNDAERRAYGNSLRRSEDAVLGKGNACSHFLARLEIKICKHLMKRLIRRGADVKGIFAVQMGRNG